MTNANAFEVEQKFPAADLATVERAAGALGAVFAAPLEQTDRYYAHPARDFAATDEALRIRRVATTSAGDEHAAGDANFVTYKGPKLDATTKTRREIELPLSPGVDGLEQFAALLEALGFRPVAEVCKSRRAARLPWQGFEIEVALDDVAEVGTFAELEISAAAEQLDAAKSALAALAQRLGLQGSERRSYLEMLLNRKGQGRGG